DLSGFPFDYRELAPYYGLVAGRIGITGAEDDMTAVFPLHDGLMEPLAPDAHSAVLLASYQRRRDYLNQKLGCLMGRARIAVLSRNLNGRQACDFSGRCLWGCPGQAFYTPSITLAECRRFPKFEYVPGVFVDHFRLDSGGRVRSVITSEANGETREF